MTLPNVEATTHQKHKRNERVKKLSLIYTIKKSINVKHFRDIKTQKGRKLSH